MSHSSIGYRRNKTLLIGLILNSLALNSSRILRLLGNHANFTPSPTLLCMTTEHILSLFKSLHLLPHSVPLKTLLTISLRRKKQSEYSLNKLTSRNIFTRFFFSFCFDTWTLCASYRPLTPSLYTRSHFLSPIQQHSSSNSPFYFLHHQLS